MTLRAHTALWSCLALALSAAPAFARTWHVDFGVAQFIAPPDRDGDEDTPFLRIADGLAVAVAGDVVVVHPGAYRENLDLPTGVELRAAFPAWGADTPLEDITELVVADPSRSGIIIGGDHAETAVVGLQITDGGAERGAAIAVIEGRARIEDNFFFLNEAGGASPLGGAIAVFDAPDGDIGAGYHVTVRNNGFAWNTAHNPDGNGRGGAIGCRANRRQPRLLIDANEFRAPVPGFENSADRGGAVYIEQCDTLVRDNWFESNRARFDGGGLYCTGAGSNAPAPIAVEGNLFRANTAVTGSGGGAYLGGCESALDHNTVVANSAASDGGGVFCAGSCQLGAVGGRNHFEGNTADRHGGGLAIVDPFDGSKVERNVFRLNVADADDDGVGDGGGVHVKALTELARTLSMRGLLDADSDIDQNLAERGGGLAVEGQVAGGGVVGASLPLSLRGFRIVGNQATFGGGVYLGGGAAVSMGDLQVLPWPLVLPLGNVIDGNLALAHGGAVYVDADATLGAFGNRIGDPVGTGNLAEDGDGGGLWGHADASVTAWFNCFASNTADRGGGYFGGGARQRLHGNSFFRNKANAGGGGRASGGPMLTFNAIHESSQGGGITCGAGGADLRNNRIQANTPYDLDEDTCGEGTDNVTGAFARVRGTYGARHFFPACGPSEPGEDDDSARGDFGDAPDDTHGPFLASYRGAFAEVPGRFPTYAPSDNAGTDRRGPSHGMVSVLWLGGFAGDGMAAVSHDGGAESTLDDDDRPNLDRGALVADQDGFDDGWDVSHLPACGPVEVTFAVSAAGIFADLPTAGAYLNVVVDWDHDGRWGGAGAACGGEVAEWVVRDLEVVPEAGATIAITRTITTGGEGDVWVRLMIAEAPIGDGAEDWDGSVAAAFALGETEDHRVCVGASVAACEAPSTGDDGPVEAGSEPEEVAEIVEVEPVTEEVAEVEPVDEVVAADIDTADGAETPSTDDVGGAEPDASAEQAPRKDDGGCAAGGGMGLVATLVATFLLGVVAEARGRARRGRRTRGHS